MHYAYIMPSNAQSMGSILWIKLVLMSNPWSCSVEEVALRPLVKFLDGEHRVISVAAAEKRLENDPNDLITKLRLADERTKEMLANPKDKIASTLKPETIIASNLAKELSAHLRNIQHHFQHFDKDDALKLSLLHSIKSRNLHKIAISPVNKAKLIECIKTLMDLIPKLLGALKNTALQTTMGSLLQTLEALNDSNELVPAESLYDYIVDCTTVLQSTLNK